MKATHGGKRRGAGRRSLFPGKRLDRPFGMDFTPECREKLDVLRRRTRLSMSDILAHLVREHLDELHTTHYPGKARRPILIRLPTAEGRRLRYEQHCTGMSYSDIGECLIRQFGHDARPELSTLARALRAS